MVFWHYQAAHLRGVNRVVHVLSGCTRGTSGNDEYEAKPRSDCYDGGEGDDLIESNFNHGGHFTAFGGPGNDTMNGGWWMDNFDGGPGNDKIAGGPNEDRLRGGPGDDTIHGGFTYDNGSVGTDRMYGDDGNDTLIHEYGSADMTGGRGADTFRIESRFTTPNHHGGTQRVTIRDFNKAEGDRIEVLHAQDGNLSRSLNQFMKSANIDVDLGSLGSLPAKQFVQADGSLIVR